MVDKYIELSRVPAELSAVSNSWLTLFWTGGGGGGQIFHPQLVFKYSSETITAFGLGR